MLAETWYHSKTGVLYPSPAMLKAMLVAHAEPLAGGIDRRTGATLPAAPSIPQGFGTPNLDKLFQTTVPVRYYDQDNTTSGPRRFKPGMTSWTVTLTRASAGQDVIVALAWTDRFALVPSGGRVVNELDLYLVQDGYVFQGNDRSSLDGYTFKKGGQDWPDGYNNVEVIRIKPSDLSSNPFTIEVVASLTGQAVPTLDGSSSNQDFALYVFNAQ